MDTEYIKKVTTAMVLLGLIVLSFFLIRPILLSIIFGVILATIFYPIYQWIYKKSGSKDFASSMVCLLLIILIVLPLWFLTPLIVNQSIKLFQASQQIDFVTPLKTIFPEVFVSESFSNEIGSTLSSSITRFANSVMTSLSSLILNFTTIFLKLLIVFFTLFFVLRDKEEFIEYIQSLSPFPKDTDKKLFKSSQDITISVLYGQVVLGILQGIVTGVGFFIFKVPNSLLLSLFAVLAGIFPIIGTAIVWVPVVIYLFIAGNVIPAIGVLIFGLASSIIENVMKPMFVSKRTNLRTPVILIAMIGGLFLFGILGIILGPLIIAYLIIILEIYRNKRTPAILLKKND